MFESEALHFSCVAAIQRQPIKRGKVFDCLLDVGFEPSSSSVPWLAMESAALAESIAADLLRKPELLSHDQICSWLDALPFDQENSGRSINGERTAGFCLGAARNGPFCVVTRQSKSYPKSCHLAQRIAHERLTIEWSAVQITRGCSRDAWSDFQRTHVDSYSAPGLPQALATFGRFEGGEVPIAPYPPSDPTWPAPPSDVKTQLRVPLEGAVGPYPRGRDIEATVHSVQDRFLAYLPHALHKPMRYRGVRYSLLFFRGTLVQWSDGSLFQPTESR